MNAPINYMLDVKNPIDESIKAYQLGGELRKGYLQNQQLEQKQKQTQQMQFDLGELAKNPDATGADYVGMMVKYPDLSDHFKKSWEILNAEQQQNKLAKSLQVETALRSGNIEVAKELLQEQITAAENSGIQREVDGAKAVLMGLEQSPEAALTSLSMFNAAILGPDKYAENRSKMTAPTPGYRRLTKEEKVKEGLDPAKPYQINEKGQITSIGSGGVTVNVGEEGKLGTIPPGYAAYKDKETGEYYMQPIKGSPQEKELQDAKKAKGVQDSLTKRASNVVIEDINRLEKKIKSQSIFQPVTGVYGESLTAIPGLGRLFKQKRVDAGELKSTISGNIGFDRLQQMREASPTGGALGQVSEMELKTLQDVLGSLELSQSEGQMLKNLDRLETLYKDMLKKVAETGDLDAAGLRDQYDAAFGKQDPLGIL